MHDAYQQQPWYGSTVPPEPQPLLPLAVPHAAPSALSGKPNSHAKRSDTTVIVLAVLAALGLLIAGLSLAVAFMVKSSASTKITQLQHALTSEQQQVTSATAAGSANYDSLNTRVNKMSDRLSNLTPYSSTCSVLSTGPQGAQDYFMPCSEQRPAS